MSRFCRFSFARGVGLQGARSVDYTFLISFAFRNTSQFRLGR